MIGKDRQNAKESFEGKGNNADTDARKNPPRNGFNGLNGVLRKVAPRLDYTWRAPSEVDPSKVSRVSYELGIPEGTARVALRRVQGNLGRAVELFRPAGSSELMPDLPRGAEEQVHNAVRRILLARKNGEAVGIYADYDTDGITSAVIMKEALERCGINPVFVYFPSRLNEGYGFHREGVRVLASQGASLIITVDCGIAGGSGFRQAAELGLDVIVTDHHIPGETLPLAAALVDPQMSEWSNSGLHDLSGAGVAYVVARRLLAEAGTYAEAGVRGEARMRDRSGISEETGDWLDLLTLSIAADGVSVLGQNRRWLEIGLDLLRRPVRPGIRALAAVARLSAGKLNLERDVTFGLVPRLNAAGRMKEAQLSYALLTACDETEATPLALLLDELNTERKATEEQIAAECLAMLEERGAPAGKALLGAWSPSWHPGVIGVVASRIRDAFWRPVALAGGSGGALKGSVRAVPGFDVWSGLSSCSKHLETWGGHREAGGFSVLPERVEAFFEDFRRYAESYLDLSSLRPELALDDWLAPDELSGQYLATLLRLEPFGPGNPRPLVGVSKAVIRKVEQKNDNGLEIHISGRSGVPLRCYWRSPNKSPDFLTCLTPGVTVDMVLSPSLRTFRGREEIALEVVDIKENAFPAGRLVT